MKHAVESARHAENATLFPSRIETLMNDWNAGWIGSDYVYARIRELLAELKTPETRLPASPRQK